MTDSTATERLLFPGIFAKPVILEFNQRQGSSDGGAVLLKAAERRYGLIASMSGCLRDPRQTGKVDHSLSDLFAQRVFSIGCGYADANDSARLAADPMHKMLLDRDPVTGFDMASQPTLSRFENAVGPRQLYSMGAALAESVIERHAQRLRNRARLVTIDLDPTDDPTHGAQQLSFFNSHYDNACYLPMMGFVMGRKGELDLVVQAGGVAAPAQHVTNASALRASLVAFFFAFWDYVLKERGGLTTLLLDDPQELLDDENRERLAAALPYLVGTGAQLILTSYDPRFSKLVARLSIPGGIEHFEVHPATRQQPVVRTTPPLPAIERRKAQFDLDRNAEEPARNFADGCRVFLESRLGDMFDDPAHSAWAAENPDPTLATFLQRLRPTVKSGPQGMFSAHVFRRFADHPALADNSPVIVLMNKAHHGRRQDIRGADVAQCADDLKELLELVEQMYEECYRWRRRDAPKDQATLNAPLALVPMTAPALNALICPDLAAFTQYAPYGQSQSPHELLDPHLLDGSVAYYLRRDNFGFAAPAGALALAEAVPGPAADRRLVIARHGNSVYARRLLRGANTNFIALTADIPDPRTKTPKTVFLPEGEVAVHQVVGIIFDHTIAVGMGQDEAVQVDAGDVLKRIEIAFRVTDDSAVPLALEKQVVLGGTKIELTELGHHKGALVALSLGDGSSVFKRVGDALPGELAHLRQFESIGGLGSSEVLSVGKAHKGLQTVTSARLIIGVLYHG